MARYSKFKEVFPDDEYHETRYFEREFSGPLSPKREEIIHRYCERHTWRESCGHEHDCCGCCFQQRTTFTYVAGQVVIRKSKHYNY